MKKYKIIIGILLVTNFFFLIRTMAMSRFYFPKPVASYVTTLPKLPEFVFKKDEIPDLQVGDVIDLNALTAFDRFEWEIDTSMTGTFVGNLVLYMEYNGLIFSFNYTVED